MTEKMEFFTGNELSTFPLTGLSLISHLVYFEGPLLSQLKADNGSVYFRHWCDCDHNYNRWMYFRVVEQDRLRALIGEKTLFELITANPDSFVFICDEHDDERISYFVPVKEIPESYLPERDFKLEYAGASDYSTAMVFEDEWEFDQLKELYKKFSQVYDFICLSSNNFGSIFNRLPWQGGFSSVHFYNKLKGFVPKRYQSGLESIHYASPGYMKITTDAKVAEHVFESIQHYFENRKDIDDTYGNLQSLIKGLDLNRIQYKDAITEFDQDDMCMREYRKFSGSFKNVDISWFNNNTESNFERCKILMAHFRRISALTQFIQEGTVRFLTDKLDF